MEQARDRFPPARRPWEACLRVPKSIEWVMEAFIADPAEPFCEIPFFNMNDLRFRLLSSGIAERVSRQRTPSNTLLSFKKVRVLRPEIQRQEKIFIFFTICKFRVNIAPKKQAISREILYT